jgi:acetyltransferase-like isoleucine patch superfamily enzyme
MIVGDDFYLNDDTVIKHKDLAVFGNHVAIDKGFYCTTEINVGDYVHLAPYVVIIGGREAKLRMGHFSGIASGSKIVCGSDDFSSGALMNPQVPVKYRAPMITEVVFEAFTCVGVNSTVMPGVTLAEGSVVGSNSVLTKSTEPWTVYVGSPARPVATRPSEKAYEYALEMGYKFS